MLKQASTPTVETSNSEINHLTVIERTYQNNSESDYTEKLAELGRNFDYASNSKHYWTKPEQSLLYGTPLYEQATETQKLALNHLYWVGNYQYIAASEASTSFYNLITSGVFENYGGYDELCEELALETDQESQHIRTFQKVGYKTKTALVGKSTLGNTTSVRPNSQWQEKLKNLLPKALEQLVANKPGNLPFAVYEDYIIGLVTKLLIKDKRYYSNYLRELEAKGQPIPSASEGVAGKVTSRNWLKFYTYNWGMSPFMACQYYSFRYTANAVLKNFEYSYYKDYQELRRKGEFIPAPTAISYYHLLDESFHTTISQTIGRDMYKAMPKPNAYEQFLSQKMIAGMQRNMVGGLSGVLAGRCVPDDPLFMLFFYKLLKSPVFEMSDNEALEWLEKCFCTEHEGFHVGKKYHENLLKMLQRFFGSLEYQTAENREMQIMAAGGSIEKALTNNIKAFGRFSQTVTKNQGN